MKKLLLILLPFCLCNCATILKGSEQSINVDSNVEGADVYINGWKVGKTPFTGKIDRESSIELRISSPGYTSRTHLLDTTLEPIFLLNFFIGIVPWVIVDFATGSMWKVSPNTYILDLKKKRE